MVSTNNTDQLRFIISNLTDPQEALSLIPPRSLRYALLMESCLIVTTDEDADLPPPQFRALDVITEIHPAQKETTPYLGYTKPPEFLNLAPDDTKLLVDIQISSTGTHPETPNSWQLLYDNIDGLDANTIM